jgi:orotate phosphoribosyltransferase
LSNQQKRYDHLYYFLHEGKTNMDIQNSPAKQIAKILLEIEAVRLNTEVFYKYVSGILSPIYVDNRRTISFPGPRKVIVTEFVRLLKETVKITPYDVIAGVATGGVPWAAWVAHELDLPLIYIRPTVKDRGMNKQIEGALHPGQKVVVVEDLITTGLSSLNAVETIRTHGGVVETVAAIFSYDSPAAVIRFKKSEVRKISLTNLSTILLVAQENHLLNYDQMQIVQAWIDTTLATWGMESA